MSNVLVSVIVVNWNGIEYIDTCLRSLINQQDAQCEIVFVDNASTDNSVEHVRENFPEILILENPVNLGFAEGNNVALNYVHGKYVLLLNTDTELDEMCIAHLTSFMEKHDKAGAIQPKLLLLNDKSTYDSCGSYFTDLAYLYHYGYRKTISHEFYNDELKCFSIKGACMMIRGSLIKKIGLFDSTFWNYYEETDFCHRSWISGYECWYVPSAVAYHKDGGSQSKTKWSATYFHNHKNKIRSFIKNFSTTYLLRYLAIYLIISLMYETFIILFQSKYEVLFSLPRAVIWNVVNIRETIAYRKRIQTQRKIEDRDIFSQVKRNPGIQYFLPWVGATKYHDH